DPDLPRSGAESDSPATGECEKLNSMTSQLLQDEQLHQKNIEALIESMNRLEKKYGEGSISRTQFDAVTDQMNKMIQGLLNKICTQEKDWGCILERLTAEMECKLDRIELDPLKKQLEDRWKSIRKQLLKQKGFEHEGAAGLKKQLISHFHCLSCDRPLDIKMPCSPNIISLPMPTYPISGYRPQRFDIDQPLRRSRGERIADLMDNFPTSARSCGGSHTLTYPRHRRCPKVYDYHPTMVQDEDHNTKWEDTTLSLADTLPPKARTNCKLPSIGGKDVNKCKPAHCPSQKSSSTRLGSGQSHSAQVPTFPQQGFAMPEQIASSVEHECQCMTDPSLPCPCAGSQTSSGQPSLLCPSADSQPKETLEIHMDTSGGQSSPVKPVNI
ncbi:glutamine-rich protein 2-like, partial [Heptranchias perlo]|uniref:glutamine-rich protein 2-like n=1 Tax=Heptranchias perlo TaxID=212740 RepID=UPI00355969DF